MSGCGGGGGVPRVAAPVSGLDVGGACLHPHAACPPRRLHAQLQPKHRLFAATRQIPAQTCREPSSFGAQSEVAATWVGGWCGLTCGV